MTLTAKQLEHHVLELADASLDASFGACERMGVARRKNGLPTLEWVRLYTAHNALANFERLIAGDNA